MNSKEETIFIKYHSKDLPKLEKFDKGDLIDLYTNSITFLNGHKQGNTYSDNVLCAKDDVVLVNLGVSMQLPKGYEASIYPRSSLFKNYGLLLTNSVGKIDRSFMGDNDVWEVCLYCTRETIITFGSRLVQFRLEENQPSIRLVEVDKLLGDNRGGFGTTGM